MSKRGIRGRKPAMTASPEGSRPTLTMWRRTVVSDSTRAPAEDGCLGTLESSVA